MTDTIERLREELADVRADAAQLRAMTKVSAQGSYDLGLQQMKDDHGAEVKLLRAEIERLQSCLYAQESVPALYAEIKRLRALAPDNLPKDETEWWIALKDQNREIERLRAALEDIASDRCSRSGAVETARRALEPKP